MDKVLEFKKVVTIPPQKSKKDIDELKENMHKCFDEIRREVHNAFHPEDGKAVTR